MFALPREIPGKLIGSTVSPGIMMMTKISDETDVDYLTNRKKEQKSHISSLLVLISPQIPLNLASNQCAITQECHIDMLSF